MMYHSKPMLDRRHFSVAVPHVWNSLSLDLKTNCDSLCSFKTNLKHTYSARAIISQCHSVPQITVISLELWHFINYVTYLLLRFSLG